MAKKHKHEEHENHERWLVSYADFITLLFAFFVVMYSVSSVNEGKYRAVSESIQAALRPVTSPPVSSHRIDVGDYKSSLIPVAGPKTSFVKKLELAISKLQGPGHPITVKPIPGLLSTDKGVLLTIADSTLFESGRADIRPEALPFLEALAEVFSHSEVGVKTTHVKVEGHTDNVPIQTAQFPSNWELSSVRAVMVVRVLTEMYQVKPELFEATGFGEFKPVADNLTPESRAKNRRVELTVFTESSVPNAPPASPGLP
ncbi:MAG: flagellar motor protein [Nitrospirae bacterium]|nr:MAG: flagellar motor protein [Nitrospirota bacterium]